MNIDESGELTFADVLNGLTRTRRSQPVAEPAAPPPPPVQQEPVDVPVEENAAIVRPYAWTGGRTRPEVQLAIETLVSTTPRAEAVMAGLRSEHQAVAQLCRHSKSVAEIAALLELPLGVVRVLLADMAALELVEVHQTVSSVGDKPDVELLHRVLRGLTNLTR